VTDPYRDREGAVTGTRPGDRSLTVAVRNVFRHRRTRRALAIALAILVATPLALIATAALTPLPPELDAPAEASVRVVDRAGRLLREVRAGDGKRARVLSLDEIGPLVPRAVIAAEDRRFHDHHGVDVLAIGRAVVQNAWHRRVVSGASTLTMQLARTLRPRPRTLAGKWREAALALRIEWSLPKRRILEAYLNHVDFGPNLRGVGAASHAYFDKPPAALSLAEAALLAGLPRGPSLYALTRRPALAEKRRDRVLARMEEAGLATRDEAAAARREPVLAQKELAAFGAPHLVAGLLSGAFSDVQPGLGAALAGEGLRGLETTIEGPLQRAAEAAALAVLSPLAGRHVTAGAVVVVENRTGDVLAYVGSPDFFDAARLGQNDGARALRQPGSALKPFLYALAMERLGFTAATVLPDVELHVPLARGEDYAPRDYDDKFRGPVRLREALGNSLNVPAVWTGEQVGAGALLTRLHELGFDGLVESPAWYGPALALGDGEVTLLELARAYATLARRGVDRPLRLVRAVERAGGKSEPLPPGDERRVMPEAFADVVTDILRDPRARRASFDEGEALRFPFEVAAKTGTSKAFRDNWCVGYTAEVTVAAWVGNFDGSAMDQVSGITGAGPLFHAVMDAATARRPPGRLPIDPREGAAGFERVAICPLSGGAPGHACGGRVFEWLPAEAARALTPCEMHEEVRLDRRNGLRAGPGCASGEVETRVFERYEHAYAAWAAGASRPVAPEAYSPLCPADDRAAEAAGGSGVEITYPHDGAHFVMDPERPRELQAVEVLVAAPPGVREVTLRVDGGAATRLKSPFSTSWRLEPGEHTLVAEVPGREGAATVRVVVR
jgi:penicillin-binding protein 1C